MNIPDESYRQIVDQHIVDCSRNYQSLEKTVEVQHETIKELASDVKKLEKLEIEVAKQGETIHSIAEDIKSAKDTAKEILLWFFGSLVAIIGFLIEQSHIFH